MMNILLKRSSSSIFSKHRPLSAAVSSIQSLLTVTSPSSAKYVLGESPTHFENSLVPGFRRNFHSGLGHLEFRASPGLSRAGIAAAAYSESPSDEGLEIAKLGIAVEIVSALAKKGIAKLFPIQRAVLEPAMQGRDMIGRAKTGTGKTLAFGIPILDKIIEHNHKHGQMKSPLAMVLAPTRELARQVEKEFCESAPSLDTLCVYGGTPISRQMSQLDHGVDVVVGTPGRVIDLLKRGALDVSQVQFLVLDEADQMLNVGFEEDVEVILEKVPKKRQTLMFSATMPGWIRKLTQKYLSDPLVIDLVGEDNQKLAEGISLYSIASDTYGRASILGPLITEHGKGGKCIVFTGTKRDADRLAYALGRSFKCEALHGDIAQNQRERTLRGFREGVFNILFATDVAARGLDIPNVDLVIHYDLPNTSEIFVHRSGRTGRAGKKGNAILIHSEHQSRDVHVIERDVGCKFIQLPRISVQGGDMLGDLMGGGGRGQFGSYGNGGGGRFGRSSGGGSGFGRSGSFGGSSSGRTGGYGEGGSGRFGSSGGSSSGRSGGFSEGGTGRFGSFGGYSSGQSGGGFGKSSSSSWSGNSSGSSSSGNFGSSKRSSGGFGDTSSGRFGGFGYDDKDTSRRSF